MFQKQLIAGYLTIIPKQGAYTTPHQTHDPQNKKKSNYLKDLNFKKIR